MNKQVFNCCQAAQALAKRGENIDRCFIGISPGGVGQSLYSAHINAVYGMNHAFIDPNIWYDEHELRKQVEQFASCFILTAQEAPETSKRMREDLYKKTMSADGIAGRRPYGYVTRMIELCGWKRMEVNRLMLLKGVTEQNFPSILRRSFLWKPLARFVAQNFLDEHYPDAELDGCFPKDPTLKDFLVSGPAIASSLQLQHGFERTWTREQCRDMIEQYCVLGGDSGLTESKMREACGLPPRQAASSTGDAVVLQPPSPSQDDAQREQLKAAQASFIELCWQKRMFACTPAMFQHCKLPDDLAREDRSKLLQTLKDHRLVQKVSRKTKGKDHYMPCLVAEHAVFAAFPIQSHTDAPFLFPEIWHMQPLRDYLSGHEAREHNLLTFMDVLRNLEKGLKKHGNKGKEETKNLLTITGRRNKLEQAEQVAAKLLGVLQEHDSQTASQSSRRKGKQAPVLERQVTYKSSSSETCPIRSRRTPRNPAAQSCPRRLLALLCPDTIDLDLENAFFCIMSQFMRRLPISRRLHDQVCATLEKCASCRESIIKEDLRASWESGKKALLEVAHGGAGPEFFSGLAFMQELERASSYMKWIAVCCLPSMYEQCLTDSSKPCPESSVLAYLYQALEDYVLQAWQSYLMEMPMVHLSLHFDGVRIQLPPGISLGLIIEQSTQRIAAATGFKEKKHYFFADYLLQQSARSEELTPNPARLKPWNCIPHALAFVLEEDQRVGRWLTEPSEINERAAAHKIRDYRRCGKELKVLLYPTWEILLEKGCRVIIHTDHRGIPASVGCIAQDKVASVGNLNLSLPLEELRGVLESCVDSSGLIYFHCFAQSAKIPPEVQAKSHAGLLDLQAGWSPLTIRPSRDKHGGCTLPCDVLEGLSNFFLRGTYQNSWAACCRHSLAVVQDTSFWSRTDISLDIAECMSFHQYSELMQNLRARRILLAARSVSLCLPQLAVLSSIPSNFHLSWDGLMEPQINERLLVYRSSHALLGSMSVNLQCSSNVSEIFIGRMSQQLYAIARLPWPCTAGGQMLYYLTGIEAPLALRIRTLGPAAPPQGKHHLQITWTKHSFKLAVDGLRFPTLRLLANDFEMPKPYSKVFVQLVRSPANSTPLSAVIESLPAQISARSVVDCCACGAEQVLATGGMSACPACFSLVCSRHVRAEPQEPCPSCGARLLRAFWPDRLGGGEAIQKSLSSSESQLFCDEDQNDLCGEAMDEYVSENSSIVTVGDKLLQLLKLEVSTAKIAPDTKRHVRCPLCPFRAFSRADRTRDHIKKYHTKAVQYCASGTKQLRVIQALFDYDQIMGQPKRDRYLARSATLMRRTVVHLDCSSNRIDRQVRLVLSGQGPKYVRDCVAADSPIWRRALNLYYDSDFANMVYQEILLSHAKLSTVSRCITA